MTCDVVLDIQSLCTEFATKDGALRAAYGVSLTVGRGEIVALVGESGSGKSVTGASILRLIDPPGRIASGRIIFEGQDLLQCSEEEMRSIRGARIAMVFQDPLTTLNPVLSVGYQMVEAIEVHQPVGHQAARARAAAALELVGIAHGAQRLGAFPHQFSGGMRQRVGIATALLNNPALIIADEPTTALDVTIQSQILFEVQRLCRNTGTAVLWITHDLSVVSGLATRVYVMYAGRIVESGPVSDVLERPSHPYTRGLLESIPSRNPRGQPLRQIDGAMPPLTQLPPGCAFQARCLRATSQCGQTPTSSAVGETEVFCWHPISRTDS